MPLLYVDTSDGEAVLAIHANTLERRLQKFRPHLAERLVTDLRIGAPGRALKEHAYGRTIGQTVRVGIFGVPFARALDRGAFIVAKGADKRHPDASGAKALHFKGPTGEVFVRFVVIKGTHYFEHALLRAPGVIAVTYKRDFGNLER